MPQGTTVAERLEMDVMVVVPRKLTKNSKKPTIPMTPRTCAMNAMTDPNLGNVGSSMGPRKSDTRKSTNRMAAFHTIGPREMTAIRTRGLGGYLPSGFGNDLTNMYAMTNSTAMKMGKITSENRTARHPARGTSPESFSEGCPSFFFL